MQKISLNGTWTGMWVGGESSAVPVSRTKVLFLLRGRREGGAGGGVVGAGACGAGGGRRKVGVVHVHGVWDKGGGRGDVGVHRWSWSERGRRSRRAREGGRTRLT